MRQSKPRASRNVAIVTLAIPGEAPSKWVGRDGRNPRKVTVPAGAPVFPKIEIPKLDEVQTILFSPEELLPCSSPEAQDPLLPSLDHLWDPQSNQSLMDFDFGEDLLGG
jgi:hypothetical protein